MSPVEARGVVAAAVKQGLIRLSPLDSGGGKGKKQAADLSDWIPTKRQRSQALSVACRMCGAEKGEPCKRIALSKEQAAHWTRLLDEDFEQGL